MKRKNDYITGDFNLINMYSAIQLKLNIIQVALLNFFIINWLAGRLEKYDEDNPANQLYWVNLYWLSRHFAIGRKYLRYNLETLTREIVCLDGVKIQIMFRNIKYKRFYVGMHLPVIHLIVNSEPYNRQCVNWHKSELQCSQENNSNKEKKTIINNMEPLFQIEDKSQNNNKQMTWAESVIKEICEMANKNNVQLYKNGKIVNVFSHLKDGQFKKQRKGIDAACKLIDDLYLGRFFRDNPVHSLFGEISKEHIEFKNANLAIERLMYLKGNKEGIKKFLCRCAKNYFIACRPGQETYQELKANFPVNVKDFILFNDYKGNRVANFLLFYSSTLTTADKQIHQNIMRIKKIVPSEVFNRLLEYEDYLLEKHIQSFWQRVYELAKEIKLIIKNEETSYSMISCFNIIFDNVNKIAGRHKMLLPGYFDIEQTTTSNSITEIKDKQ